MRKPKILTTTTKSINIIFSQTQNNYKIKLFYIINENNSSHHYIILPHKHIHLNDILNVFPSPHNLLHLTSDEPSTISLFQVVYPVFAATTITARTLGHRKNVLQKIHQTAVKSVAISFWGNKINDRGCWQTLE